MYMAAQVRIFLPVYPQPLGPSWADTAYTYVETFVATGLSILCLALSHVADLRPGSRWAKYSAHFGGPLADHFVNVVIGVNPTPTIALRYIENLEDDEVSYEPELARLFTVGVPNLAILGSWPRPLDEAELKALGHYARILTPTEDEVVKLAEIGITATCVPPTNVAALTQILHELLA